jgi:amino acid adenylation domain-containing protein
VVKIIDRFPGYVQFSRWWKGIDQMAEKVAVAKIYSLTPMQQGMLYHSLVDQNPGAYLVQMQFGVSGDFDPELFAQSVRTIVGRYDIFRTVFIVKGVSQPKQVVLTQRDLKINYQDISYRFASDQKTAYIEEYKEIDREKGFDISKDILLRVAVFKTEEDRYEVVWAFHHILLDGWSQGIVMSELFQIYDALADNRVCRLNPVSPFNEYINWLEKKCSNRDSLQFWKAYLDGFTERSVVPASWNKKDKSAYVRAEYSLGLNQTVTKGLNGVAAGNQVTLSTVLQTLWGILLQKYNDQSDVVFGSVVSGRPPEFPGVERMTGLLINTIPVRIRCEKDEKFSNLVRNVQAGMIAAEEHSYFPLAEIQACAGLKQNLIHHVVGFENYPVENSVDSAKKASGRYRIENVRVSEQTHYDLNIVMIPGTGMKLKINYNRALYEDGFIGGLGRHFQTIADQVVKNPEISIRRISLLSDAEREQILYGFNETARPYSRRKLIHQLFEEQAQKSADRVALLFEGREVSYGDLNARANRLARLLNANGVKRGEPVGILMDRSIEMIVGVLSVLKAGALYAPLDPSHPAPRIANILSNLGVSHLITQSTHLGLVYDLHSRLPCVTDVIFADIATEHLPVEKFSPVAVTELWNQVAQKAFDSISAGGFISSYTGAYFTFAEVEAYQNYVVQLARLHLPQNGNVLEIGCGSGLLMFEIAGFAASYTGLDPSDVTQAKNRQFCKQKGYDHIRIVNGFAHEIDKLPEDHFDLILMASVIQFFPGFIYLEDVIKKALALLKQGGVILLADVMDLNRKSDFWQSLVRFKNDNWNRPLLKTKTDLENELYVGKEYFIQLEARLPSIEWTRIIERQDRFRNELDYRYDVLIKKGVADRNGVDPAQPEKLRFYTAWHLNGYSGANIFNPISSDAVAYIIHTSGSTGVPKGVAVQHRPVINLIEWVNATFKISPNDRILFVTSLCFDLSVYDIFGILAAGGSIHIASRSDIRNPQKLLRLLCNGGITFWDSAPAAFQQLVMDLAKFREEAGNSSLKRVFLSGDWIPVTLPDTIRDTFKNAEIVSLGGATEATVWSNFFPIDQIDGRGVSIPYGKPIWNAAYYILDSDLYPCPPGIAGDLYIGGECLALGYANDAELTAAKFPPNPFGASPGARLYKTGDIARWFADGNMEFLGRKDGQVKIRGYRIELGEIEYQISRIDGVKGVVAAARKDQSGTNYLTAYFVADREIGAAEMKARLSKNLPDYMVPAYLIQLEALPVTPNGKLDRKALPEPENLVESGPGYREPQNELQSQLVAIWSSLLGIRKEKIGIEDDFFELGGHSLLAIKLEAAIQQSGIRIADSEVYLNIDRCKTIRELADFIEMKGKAGHGLS